VSGWGSWPGRTRLGDARFRRAAVAFSVSLTVLLAVFSLMSRGVLWLVITLLVLGRHAGDASGRGELVPRTGRRTPV
jgi:predicted signal transduction protein with EAL and GGDEF domain